MANVTQLLLRLPGAPRWYTPASRLPARIRERIRGQEERSEILVGWIQLAFIAAMGTVYAIAPKKFAEDAPFAPVPWVLAAYALFTVIRLMLAHKRMLPRAFIYASIVVDMALLLGLIFSFHVQYRQPPSFYLKSPTLMYVYVLIALRALNFEARYIVTAGLVAAFGWLALVLYAVTIDPRDSMVTRDYITYLTSNSVLIGAEVDKIISILVFTAVLALASKRTARLLEFAAIESASNQELSRFVPDEVASQLKRADQVATAGQGETSEATVLFLDIEGFTSISENLRPESVVRTLNEFYAAAAEPIQRQNGVINQFQGDSIIATFNAPRPNPSHAASAVAAAVELVAMCRSRSFGDGTIFSIRIGINTGAMVCGLVGTPDHLVYTVIGDEVNLASRLEVLNKEYGTRIIVSESTRQSAGPSAFAFEPIGEVAVRGRSAKTPVHTLRVGQAGPP
ncbi:MAG TPA: adenylate/guanylate cyclase domain-containing protein [Casimicrobiaceae bacterium]|nr:adenylate/guanylate cyclase domain-containing protein [Casimicrobiaceae bacterium]